MSRLIRTFFIFALFVTVAVPDAVFAQGASEELSDCGTSVCTTINASRYDENTRTVEVDVTIWNNHGSFIDDLTYDLQFYTGENLPETGYIFNDVQYVSSVYSEVEPLHPNEVITQTISWVAPETVPGGNYYNRATVSNEDKSIFGITFSRNPITITGRGGYVPFISAVLVNPATDQLHSLMEGPILSLEETPFIAIPQDLNVDLFETLEKEEVYYSYAITDVAGDVVSSVERQPLGLLFNEEGVVLEVPFPAWEGLRSGAFLATLSFENFREEQIAPDLPVRLLYEGFFAKIYELHSEINSYRKGEPLNLALNLLTAGDASNEFPEIDVNVELTGTKGQVLTFKKTVPLEGGFQGDDKIIDFLDQSVPKSIIVEQVKVSIVDAQGVVYDERVMNFDTDVIYAYDSPYGTLTAILILLGVLLVGTGIALYLKKRGHLIVIVLCFFGLVTLLGAKQAPGYVFADASLGPEDISQYYTCSPAEDPEGPSDSSDSGDSSCTPQLNGGLMFIWSETSNEPSGEIEPADCGVQCEDVTWYLKVQCKDCGNAGLDIEAGFNHKVGNAFASDAYSDNDSTYYLSTLLTSPYLEEYGSYTVQRDAEAKYAQNSDELPEGALAGGACNCSDVINWWLYGPFVDTVCYGGEENYSEGDIEGDAAQHEYNLYGETTFGPGYCELSFVEEDANMSSSTQRLNDPRTIEVKLCPNIKTTFYLDDDGDGEYDVGESYIKDSDAPVSCSGVEGNILAHLYDTVDTSVDFTELRSTYCTADSRPYAFVGDFLAGDSFMLDLDQVSRDAGWVKTGITLNRATTTETIIDIFPIDWGEELEAYIGVEVPNAVIFSCGASPETIAAVPDSFDFDIENFYSDEYTISELNFLWSGQTGSTGNQTISGGVNNGRFTTTYSEATGGVETYTVNVYAENSSGERVSGDVSCQVTECVCPNGYTCVSGMCEADLAGSCAAYDNASATGNPKLFFGPGEFVYWKATPEGGDDPYAYNWGVNGPISQSNAAQGDDQIVGPYSVGEGNDYDRDDGPIFTATVDVTDTDASSVEASCSISVKECNVDADCPPVEICRQSDYTCALPEPAVIEPLFINPSVVNAGGVCNLRWEIDNVDFCELYKNGVLHDPNAGTTTLSSPVEISPGSYLLHCENAEGDYVDAGPARCLLNPQVRES